jgi:hypothetical protein
MVQGWRPAKPDAGPVIKRIRRQKDIKFIDMILSETEVLAI